MKPSVGVACLGAMLLSGCGVPDYVSSNTASVNLLIAGISPQPLQSDVLEDNGVEADNANVAIAVRFKNQATNVTITVPNHVLVERYEVNYVRSDGRGVEGLDVPFRISGNLTWEEDVKTSGTSSYSLEVVRAQAKLEPPLMNLRNGGGALIITAFAQIRLYGRTVSGEPVEASASLQIDFADWAD
jgi:hypothetical protein